MPLPTRSEIKVDLIDVLRTHGALKTSDVYEKLSAKWGLTSAEKSIKRSDGPLFKNEIRWARQELAIAGIIERPTISGYGHWMLSAEHTIAPEHYDDEEDSLEEGSKKQITVNAYERNKEARDKCLAKHGYICAVCGFDFLATYGSAAKKCIHVHHLIEISSIGKKYKINPTKDLIPVCPNCHYVIHRRKPAYTPEEVRAMLKANNSFKPTPHCGAA